MRTYRTLWLVVESVCVTGLTFWLATHFQRPILWLLIPLVFVLLRRERLDAYGLALRFCPPSLLAHASIGATALILYTAGYMLVGQVFQGQKVAFSIPPDWPTLVFSQLFAVALPEEFFFRGYLQTAFNRGFGTPYCLFGAPIGPGLLSQAVAFALCHLPQGGWVSLRVFFFALLAGWLRDRSGSLLAPVMYHTLGNVWVEVLHAK